MSFEIQECPSCNSRKFKEIKEHSIICNCLKEFAMRPKDFINGKEAQEILEITTRQGLNKIVNKFDIYKIPLGKGKPNIYLKSDVIDAHAKSHSQREKYNPNVSVKKKEKKEKKEVEAKELVKKKKEVEQVSFNPLNEIGTQEKLRVEQELESKGLFMQLDQSLLLSYAIAYQNYMFYVNLSSQLSHTSTDDNGNEKVHPYFTVADKFFNQMEKLSKVLGIGARNRIGLEIKQPKTGAMADILNRNRSK